MALSGTDRGTGGNTSTSTTLAVVPTSNFTPGTLAVLCAGWDNSSGAGADPYVSITDNAGNVWTSRQAVTNDPAGAAAGSVLRIFTARISKLTTSDTITITLSPTTVSKAWTLMEVAAAAGNTVEYLTGATNTNTTANPTITSGSITNGDMIVGAFAAESNAAITGDADSTNGSWSAVQTGSAGNATSLSNIETCSQRKVVTGTATQTYNVTLTASDYCGAWISLDEVAIPLYPTPGVVTGRRR